MHLFTQTYQITTRTYSTLRSCTLDINKRVTLAGTHINSVRVQCTELHSSQCHEVPSRHRDCLLLSGHRVDLSFRTLHNGSDYPVWLNKISYCCPNCSSGVCCPLSMEVGRLGKHLFPKLHLAWCQSSSG